MYEGFRREITRFATYYAFFRLETVPWPLEGEPCSIAGLGSGKHAIPIGRVSSVNCAMRLFASPALAPRPCGSVRALQLSPTSS